MVRAEIDPRSCDAIGLRVVVADQGTTTTIQLDGECDLAHQEVLRKAIREVLNHPPPECVVLDLSRLSFIDSSGVHAVVELGRRASRENVRLVVISGPSAVQRVFEICGLTTVLPFISRRPNGR
jgi:anti-sigma B factor antagonist